MDSVAIYIGEYFENNFKASELEQEFNELANSKNLESNKHFQNLYQIIFEDIKISKRAFKNYLKNWAKEILQ